MSWTAPYTYTVGQTLTAANLNTYMSANLTYLKAETDKLYVTVYNNDSITLMAGTPISFDPTYTSGLGVIASVTAFDPRCIGTVKYGSAISSHSSGPALCPGFVIQNVPITGTVIFGHSLSCSTTPLYAQDSGGSGVFPGMIGWALAANPSGNATISVLCRYSSPSYYSGAVSWIRAQGFTGSVSSGGTVTSPSFTSDGSNRLLVCVVYVINGSSNIPSITGTFNGGAMTALENVTDSVSRRAYIFYQLAPAVVSATCVLTVTGTGTNTISADVMLFNGTNQSTPMTAKATNSATSNSPAVTDTVAAGDYVIGVTGQNSNNSVSSRGAGQTNLDDYLSANTQRVVTDYALATSTTQSFSWTMSGSLWWAALEAVINSA